MRKKITYTNNIDAVFAIDAGKKGGIAVSDKEGNLSVYKMPDDITRVKELIDTIKQNHNVLVMLEKLSIRPDDMIAQRGEGANFGKLYRIQNMMANYEQLKAVLMLCDVPYILIHPASWQAKLGIRVKGEDYRDRKKRYKHLAQTLFPNIRVTMMNADALLIMQCGWHILKEEQKWAYQNLPEAMKNRVFEVKTQ